MTNASKYGFFVGARVMATEEAFQNGVFKRKDAPVFGTVTKLPDTPLGIKVRRDNRKTESFYYAGFWHIVPKNRGRKRANKGKKS